MSTIIAEPERQTNNNPSQRLKAAMAAARDSVHWFGVRKALTSQQMTQALTPLAPSGVGRRPSGSTGVARASTPLQKATVKVKPRP